MYKKALIGLFALVSAVVGCSVATDHWYSNSGIHKEISVDYVFKFGGCSAICLNTQNNKSYLVTAKHCRNQRGLEYNGQTYNVLQMWCDSERDICVLEVEGKLPEFTRKILNDKSDNKQDIVIGYVQGKLTTKYGEAVPGQSGGAVLTENGDLWGIVSTTGQGTSIMPAIKRMGLEWTLKKN